MRTVTTLVLAFSLLSAAAVCFFQSKTYFQQDRNQVDATASLVHLAGTDDLGRDRCVRIAVAILLSLGGAALASLVATMFGIAGGVLAAYGPTWTAPVVRYLSDLFHTLPWLFLLMILRAAMPLNEGPWRSASVTFALFAFLGAPIFLRLNHERATAFLQSQWMLHAHAMGLRSRQQVRYLLPHLRPLFWAQFLLYLPACIISEANLGTLGLGLPEPLPSFGTFLAELQSNILLGTTWLNLLPVFSLLAILVAMELYAFGVTHNDSL